MNDPKPDDQDIDVLMKLVLNDSEDLLDDSEPAQWPELSPEEAAVIENVDLSFLKKMQKKPRPAAPILAEQSIGSLTGPIKICCRFCKGAFARQEAVYCASCLAPHHVDCHQRHGQCSVLECRERRVVYSQVLQLKTKKTPLLFAAVIGCLFGVAAMTWTGADTTDSLPKKSLVEQRLFQKSPDKKQSPMIDKKERIQAATQKPIELQIRALALDFKPPQSGILLVPMSFDELFFHKVGWSELWNIDSTNGAVEEAALALQKLDFRIEELKAAVGSAGPGAKQENQRVLAWLLKEIRRLDRESEERIPGYLGGHLAFKPRVLDKPRK
ncbi:MAG: hypothetical protein P1V97_03745 [Planctomycetota bacterium]|nr:hypothetical protein [Planctomycetota bacterium]